jgi:hypothetical protein
MCGHNLQHGFLAKTAVSQNCEACVVKGICQSRRGTRCRQFRPRTYTSGLPCGLSGTPLAAAMSAGVRGALASWADSLYTYVKNHTSFAEYANTS